MFQRDDAYEWIYEFAACDESELLIRPKPPKPDITILINGSQLQQQMISKAIILVVIPLLLSAAAYDESLSRISASYAAITHCSGDIIKPWNCKLCKQIENLTDITVIDDKISDIFGFIGYNSARNKIFVIWRGTIDTKNWIEDITFDKVDYVRCKGCKVHLGFYLSYESVANQANDAVASLIAKYPTAYITVGGHSLGGALSTISAIELQFKFNKVSELYAHGCPRVGNLNFGEFIRTKIPSVYRVIHNKDLVPHLPFEWLQFHHPAYEVLYEENMIDYKICDASGQDPSCSNRYYPQYDPNDHDLYFVQQGTSAC